MQQHIIFDQLGRSLLLNKTPQRIVSLVPSLTELLVYLGLENKIVGITKFCIHPTNLRKTKQIVGGTKKINIKKIIALQPDLILCNKEENTKKIVESCEQISPVYVSDINTIEQFIYFISQLGDILNVQSKSGELIKTLDAKISDFKKFIQPKPTLKIAYLIWKKPWMVAGDNCFINELLTLNKFENAFLDKGRYPSINDEELTNLDLILLSSEPYPFKEKDILELKKITKSKIILVDGEFFSWYGSRLLNAFDYFKKLHLLIHK